LLFFFRDRLIFSLRSVIMEIVVLKKINNELTKRYSADVTFNLYNIVLNIVNSM